MQSFEAAPVESMIGGEEASEALGVSSLSWAAEPPTDSSGELMAGQSQATLTSESTKEEAMVKPSPAESMRGKDAGETPQGVGIGVLFQEAARDKQRAMGVSALLNETEDSPTGATGELEDGRLSAATLSTQSAQDEAVVQFIRDIMRGRLVTLVGEASAGLPATCSVDQGRQRLQFVASDSTKMSQHCNLVDIVDLYAVSVDGEDRFPRTLLDMMREEEKSRLLRLRYRVPGAQARSVCFLEADVQGVLTMMQVLKGLCAHAAGPRRLSKR
eukprot:CAMPEP_0176020870 /NCGR_PEP_ID=MMETSP0120_2-20121206/10122_1 /TAXON_ID=160619 /ORGANISM="Kryptoperidinium foliaceum, Strain CCMP 1326" /LENGTH=271 /DNA_ID=CAMNT_0017353977 /DNA_START=27 /DNA_END=842 /DNA_ORIENTATION=+